MKARKALYAVIELRWSLVLYQKALQFGEGNRFLGCPLPEVVPQRTA